jgi:hypothetical protein
MTGPTFIQSELEELQSYQPKAYEALDLNRLTVYGISLLKEKAIPVTFETIVVALFRLFPKKFCLVGFEQYPDATRVNRALLQLRPKYRNWATGDVQHGFVLTESGKKILEETKQRLLNPRQSTSRTKASRTRDLNRDIEDIQSSAAFTKFQAGNSSEISRLDVWGFLKASPYTPGEALRSYIDNLEVTARALERNDVVAFLDCILKRFPDIFRKKEGRSAGTRS